jgi:hypothetical protein
MSPISNGLRWKLILGCLVLGAILAPESALVVVQDLRGPWGPARGEASRESAVALVPDAHVLKPARSEASVALQEQLVRARRDPFRTDPRPVAVLVAR